MTVIETGGNLGYARGNNAGIRFALEGADIDIVWLLNNDGLVAVQPQDAGRRHRRSLRGRSGGGHVLGSPPRYYRTRSRAPPDAERHALQLLDLRRPGIAAGSAVGAPEDPGTPSHACDTYFVCGASLASNT